MRPRNTEVANNQVSNTKAMCQTHVPFSLSRSRAASAAATSLGHSATPAIALTRSGEAIMAAAARGFVSRLGGPGEPLDGDNEDLAVDRGGVGERASECWEARSEGHGDDPRLSEDVEKETEAIRCLRALADQRGAPRSEVSEAADEVAERTGVWGGAGLGLLLRHGHQDHEEQVDAFERLRIDGPTELVDETGDRRQRALRSSCHDRGRPD